MHNKLPPFSIEEMTPDDPEWQELVDVITHENQARWAFMVNDRIIDTFE